MCRTQGDPQGFVYTHSHGQQKAHLQTCLGLRFVSSPRRVFIQAQQTVGYEETLRLGIPNEGDDTEIQERNAVCGYARKVQENCLKNGFVRFKKSISFSVGETGLRPPKGVFPVGHSDAEYIDFNPK